MLLCPLCRLDGYCRNLSVELVKDRDLDNSEYIRDLRAFAFGLSINDKDWHERLSNFYRDYQGWVVGAEKREVFMDMEEFEREHIREWFRDFCCTPCPSNVVPRVRPEAREGQIRLVEQNALCSREACTC